ncbi:MAG: hypothetical protein H0X41_10390 [Chitinophagaceae bacterium]|nr:hypothetical protein [Chitinophagaceae bacterium]
MCWRHLILNQLVLSLSEKLLRKKTLKQFCSQVLEERIAATRATMARAQEAANGEEKSSAGDKYETSRAMNHLEKDMYAKQLMDHLQALGALRMVPAETLYDEVQPGALIRCDTVTFFIAAGLGKQCVGSESIIFLSPLSPLANKILHKRVGSVIEFTGEPVIMDIY